MKIIDNCQRTNKVEHVLKLGTLDFNGIQDGDYLLIPIEDPELRNVLSDQICEIAGNCDWILPDAGRTKINLCINTMSDELETTLHLEVHPPLWTRERIENIINNLINPDTPIFADQPETPRDLYNFIFEMAQLHNEGKLEMEDNDDFLEVQFTNEERIQMLEILRPLLDVA